MTNAPFGMTVISNDTPESAAARVSLQAVLDDFNPTNGPTYEAHQDAQYNTTVWNWKKAYWIWAQNFETRFSGDNSDPDGDGVPNILERAFGWNPTIGTNVMPKIVLAGNVLEVTYSPAGGGSDVTITVDVTDNLTNTWDSSSSSIETTGTNPLTKSDRTTAEEADTRFMRFRASRTTQWLEP